MFKSRGGREKGEKRAVRQPHFSEGQDGYTFRRSRTISGSVSNSVTATKSKQPNLKSDRVKLHELHASKRFLKATIAILILLSLTTFFLLANSVMLARTDFQAVSISQDDRASLRRSISQFINTHPSQAFVFTLNEEQLITDLQARHPEVASVEATVSLFGGEALTVHFRKPIVAWDIKGKRFYVDKQGVAFKKNYNSTPTLKVEDTTGYVPELAADSPVASGQFISYLGQLLGYLRLNQVSDVSRVVIPSAPRQVDIYLAGKGYPIKTNTDRNPSIQAQDIKHALHYFDQRRVTPQYIDVRIEGKAFYK